MRFLPISQVQLRVAMSSSALDNLANSLRDAGNKAADAVRDNQEIAIGVGASVALLGAWRLYSGSGKYKRKPGAFELSGGSIDRKKIDHTFKDYSASYGKEAGAGITDRNRTTELVGVICQRFGFRLLGYQIGSCLQNHLHQSWRN